MHELRSELDTRKYVSQLSRRDTSSALTSYHGFHKISGGVFSSVLVHPKLDYIIKLFDNDDEGYKLFLGIALANQKNPHFPQIRGRPMQIGSQTQGIRLEKLTPMSGSEFEDLEYMLAVAKSDPNWEENLTPNGIAREFLDKWPRFAQALNTLRDAKDSGTWFDWHGGNIMKRSDGTPVIIDPFV